jgi:hypothetical protein
MTGTVITAARRTPVGSFMGAFGGVPAHELGRTVLAAVMSDAGLSPADVDEVILGQVLTAGHGQNPARQASMAPASPKRRRPGASIRSAARACAPLRWLASHPVRRCPDHHRRRPGIDEPCPARPGAARRHQNGRLRACRHDDQGRAVGRLQRLSHGHHRRKCRRALSDQPVGTGRIRRCQPEQGQRRPRRRPLQGSRSRRSRSRAARATPLSIPTSISATAPRSTASPG